MREKKQIKNKKGFTLIEILVSIFLFSIVIGSIITIFILAVRQQNIILRNQLALNQISYAVEFMSRSLRMASKELGSNCLSTYGCNYETTSNGIKFINALDNNDCQLFFLENEQLKYKKSYWSAGIPLTATSSMRVRGLRFILQGECQDDIFQPRVTIFLEVENPIQGGEKIKIQTTISQRNLDVQY